MSLLATIDVHKCDGCDAIELQRNDDDVDSFIQRWFVGMSVDFCPICRAKLEHQAAIESDSATPDPQPTTEVINGH